MKKAITYNTLLEDTKTEQNFDFIVFTSPSNYDGYLKQNTLEVATKVIVLGETTMKHIQKNKGDISVFQTESPKESDIIKLLKKLTIEHS